MPSVTFRQVKGHPPAHNRKRHKDKNKSRMTVMPYYDYIHYCGYNHETA